MNTDSDTPRLLNEAEVRSIACLLIAATAYTRRTIAEWFTSERKPKKDEMMDVVRHLFGAEARIWEMAAGPPSDGRSLDHLANFFHTEAQKESIGELGELFQKESNRPKKIAAQIIPFPSKR
jgi:hypothetical protein